MLGFGKSRFQLLGRVKNGSRRPGPQIFLLPAAAKRLIKLY